MFLSQEGVFMYLDMPRASSSLGRYATFSGLDGGKLCVVNQDEYEKP